LKARRRWFFFIPVAAIAITAATCQAPIKKMPPTEVEPAPPGVQPCTSAAASTVGPLDFEDYTPGSINGQDGWVATGTYDQAVVENPPSAPDDFGAQSWRLSNATTGSSFADMPFSKAVANEAGESTAENGSNLVPSAPKSGGTRQPCFAARFAVASFTGAAQDGVRFTVSPDRGDGARMSFLAIGYVAGQLDMSFSEVDGTGATPTPCTGCANFVATPLGSFDPAVPHTISIVMQFVDGDANDVVQVFVDDVLEHTGRSWEDYYKLDGESNGVANENTFQSRTVDSLLFRVSGAAESGAAGQGFLIDDLGIATGS